MAIKAVIGILKNKREAKLNNEAADAMQFARSFEGMPDFNPDNTPTDAFKARSVAKAKKEDYIKRRDKKNS